MNIALQFRENLAALGNNLVDELDQLVAGIRSHWLIQHKNDGSHSDITGDSVTVDGDIVAGADITSGGEGVFSGNVEAAVDTGGNVGSVETGVLNTDDEWENDSPEVGVRVGRSTRGWLVGAVSGLTAWLWSAAVDASSGPVLSLERESANTYALGGPSVGSGTNVVDLGQSSPSQRRFRDLFLSNKVYERGRSTALGEWTDVAYSAGNFTSSSGTWTVDSGDQIRYGYTLIGKTMVLAFDIRTTDVASGPQFLRITVPGGFTIANRTNAPIIVRNAGASHSFGMAFAETGLTYLSLGLPGFAAWTNTTGDNTDVFGTIIVQVQ